jgi:hypothetical protein
MEAWPSSASVNTLRRPDPDSYSDGDVDQSDGPDGGGDDRAPQFSIMRARRPFKAAFRLDSPDLGLDFDPRDVISMHGRRRGGVSRALLEEVFLTFSGPLLVVTEEDEDEEVEDAVEIKVDVTVPEASPTYDMEWRVHFLTSIPECSREDGQSSRAERAVNLMAELAARTSANVERFAVGGLSERSINPWLIDDLSV